MAYDVQRIAVIELGPDAGSLTDYTCDVSEFTITEQRATVVKSPSFGSPRTIQRGASQSAQVVMTFTSTPNASSGLVNALRAAQNTVTGELFFKVRYESGSVSASNPSQSGWLLVAGVTVGAAVSATRVQTQTFPARDITESAS